MSKGYSFAGIRSEFLPKFVSLHVNVDSDAKIVAHAVWKGRIPDPVAIDLPNKIRLEIGHWIGVFLRLSDPEQARLLGDRTRQTFGGMDRESIARTLRCLRALEGFLVGSSYYRIPYPRWRSRIVEALNKPSGKFLLPGSRRGFRVAASLLLIRALAWSQSGWNQPYLWEAYSSLQARQDHEEWLPHEAASRLVELLAYLIRFQSAPGQLDRETGDADFLDQAEHLGVGKKVALTLLGVVAWALDFRNRELPPRSGQTQPEKEADLVQGVGVYKHKRTNWSRAMAIIEGSLKLDRRRLKTWSYTKWLTDASDSRRNFQDFQEWIERESPADLTNYSFGREYHSPQHQKAMAAAIECTVNEPPRLHEMLRFDTLQVPHWKGGGGYEKVQIIRLPAEIGAAYSVFSEPAAEPPGLGLPEPDFPAWRIFLHLFRTAQQIGHIREDFCPTALIGRFLEVCHAIAPQDCISIPVRVNDRPLDFIHLPKVPEPPPEGPEVGIVARFVPAFVLNHVMTREVHSCDVGLRMLSEVEGGSFWYRPGDAGSPIEKAIRENRFRLLLEDYLNDYRAEPSAVDLQKSSFDLFSRAAPGSSRLGNDLKSLEKQWKKSLLFAGIDVGGTLTKIQVYKVSFRGGRISLVPFHDKKPVKILTRFDNGPGQPSSTDPAERARVFAKKVAGKIREILGDHPSPVNGVGVAWPGPVRNNRIQGTSGILSKLGFSNQITDNDIAEIMRLPLAEILAEEIFGRPAPLEEPFGPHQPPVAILNDGDAHALAVLSPYALNQIRKPGKGVVVKLGTGTAGAVVTDGNLDAGLMEFGKIVVNLAAAPDAKFPSGLATKYVSAKALQGYAKKRLASLNRKVDEPPTLHPEIEAIEIGLLAGLAPTDTEETKRSGLREIRWQSGVIHLAALLELAEGESEVVLDAAELNRLRDLSEWTLRDPTREEVMAKLGILQLEDRESFEEYTRRVNGCGTTRLQTILGLRDREKKDFQDFLKSGTLGRELYEKIDRVAQTCQSAVEELGERLADLLALLYGELGMDYAMLGGGVLSGKTGKTALDSLSKRFRHYSWFSVLERDAPTESGDNITLDFKRNTLAASGETEPPPEHAPVSPIDDHGTLGAAVWGAREYVRQIRLAGLQKASEKVQRLHLTESLSLEPGRVRAGENDAAPIDLDKYVLEVGDVLRYLDDSARVLGVVRTRTDPLKPEYVFTRWLGA